MKALHWLARDRHSCIHARSRWEAGSSRRSQVLAVFADEDGPRGDGKFFSTNHVLISAAAAPSRACSACGSMWSLEPSMGKRGYPLLLRDRRDRGWRDAARRSPASRLADGARRDLQPRPFGADRSLYLYAAAVGSPALRPPTFMHRAWRSRCRSTPITHHWFDSSHVTFSVVTFGAIVSPKAKIEASVFRGREPDQERWGSKRARFVSFRLSVNPTPHLSCRSAADSWTTLGNCILGPIWRSCRFGYVQQAVDALVGGRARGVGRNKRSPASFPLPAASTSCPARWRRRDCSKLRFASPRVMRSSAASSSRQG